jgi:hypothetical protein
MKICAFALFHLSSCELIILSVDRTELLSVRVSARFWLVLGLGLWYVFGYFIIIPIGLWYVFGYFIIIPIGIWYVFGYNMIITRGLC